MVSSVSSCERMLASTISRSLRGTKSAAESIGMDRFDPLLKALQRGDLGVDALAREVFELRVVLVKANQRSRSIGA